MKVKKIWMFTTGFILLVIISIVLFLIFTPINREMSYQLSRATPMDITLYRPDLPGETAYITGGGKLENKDISTKDKERIRKLLSNCKLEKRYYVLPSEYIGLRDIPLFSVCCPLPKESDDKERLISLHFFYRDYKKGCEVRVYYPRIVDGFHGGRTSEEPDGFDVYWLDEDITALHQELLKKLEQRKAEEKVNWQE